MRLGCWTVCAAAEPQLGSRCL